MSHHHRFRLLTSSALALALLLAPVGAALANSATAGMDPDSESRGLPSGKIPVRPAPVAPAPFVPPPFRLTPPSEPDLSGAGVFKPETFTLSNGLALVVIPNHRAPIVSHMVWYQVGAADEPVGKSGLAHLLEHLMFKGTPTVTDGEFSRTIAAQGGNDNAFTSWDYTAYFQNIAKDRLETAMTMEADRMANLTLSEAQVDGEKKVVLAERAQTTDNEPQTRLSEAIRTTEFVHHPYGRPIVGWKDEVADLKREDALAFYRTWYSPANAVVVVSGDVNADEVKALAEKTYGKLAARPVPLRNRLREPVIEAERKVVLREADIKQPMMMRSYHAPSWHSGDKTQVVPLQVLSEILGGGTTARLYRRLVMDLHLATDVQVSYDPVSLDMTTATISISPAPDRTNAMAEEALDAALKDLLNNGVSEAELNRAQKRLVDGAVFARDSVQAPAHLFGMTLATGGDISDIEDWPKRVMAVTSDDVMKAARALFSQKGFVSGALEPETKE